MRKINQILMNITITVSLLFSACVIYTLRVNLDNFYEQSTYAVITPLHRIDISEKEETTDKIVSENEEIENILWNDGFTKYFGDIR